MRYGDIEEVAKKLKEKAKALYLIDSSLEKEAEKIASQVSARNYLEILKEYVKTARTKKLSKEDYQKFADDIMKCIWIIGDHLTSLPNKDQLDEKKESFYRAYIELKKESIKFFPSQETIESCFYQMLKRVEEFGSEVEKCLDTPKSLFQKIRELEENVDKKLEEIEKVLPGSRNILLPAIRKIYEAEESLTRIIGNALEETFLDIEDKNEYEKNIKNLINCLEYIDAYKELGIEKESEKLKELAEKLSRAEKILEHRKDSLELIKQLSNYTQNLKEIFTSLPESIERQRAEKEKIPLEEREEKIEMQKVEKVEELEEIPKKRVIIPDVEKIKECYKELERVSSRSKRMTVGNLREKSEEMIDILAETGFQEYAKLLTEYLENIKPYRQSTLISDHSFDEHLEKFQKILDELEKLLKKIT